MKATFNPSASSLDSLLTSIRAAMTLEQKRKLADTAARPPIPFVTISRESGARGRTLARRLVDRLNEVDPGDRPWACWDRELVQKVAAEHHIAEGLVEALEGSGRSWLEQLLGGLSFDSSGTAMDDHQVFRRLAGTLFALAEAGRAVIVGRGGVHLTSKLRGGLHLRLVSPLEQRIARVTALQDISPAEAAKFVQRVDRERDAFHKRYCGGAVLSPERFALTLNTAALPEEVLVECLLPAVAAKRHVGKGP